MGGRLELTRQANHQKIGPVDTEGVHPVAEASSVEAGVEAVVFLEEVETAVMGGADLNPEAEDMEVPETITAAAGVKEAMVTGLQEGLTETAMTVMVSPSSRGNAANVCGNSES